MVVDQHGVYRPRCHLRLLIAGLTENIEEKKRALPKIDCVFDSRSQIECRSKLQIWQLFAPFKFRVCSMPSATRYAIRSNMCSAGIVRCSLRVHVRPHLALSKVCLFFERPSSVIRTIRYLTHNGLCQSVIDDKVGSFVVHGCQVRLAGIVDAS